jgi:photosynthetic reaction center cytochrome c subunit
MQGKRILILAALIVLTMGAFVGTGVKAQSNGSGPAAAAGPTTASAPQSVGKKAEEQFKNIQVLKGIPADQLVPSMQFITASLGVQCDFCHVQGAFEKDDKKPKQTARKMMEMMFAINKENFAGHRDVTCYSCHRGATVPVGTPLVMTEEPKEMASSPKKPEGDAKPDAEPSAEQLLAKYVQAAGGAAAIEKASTRVMKGSIEFGGKSLPIDIYSKDPDMRVSLTHMPEGESVTAFDGHSGWMGMPGGRIREMQGAELDGAAIDADLHLATHLKGLFTAVKVHGAEKVGDHEAYFVIGERGEKPPIHLYFEQESGLLVRMVRFGETALGTMPVQIDYADYRDVAGIKVPYRWTLARPGGRFTIQVSDVKENVPVDDAKFVKPPAPPEPAKAPAK